MHIGEFPEKSETEKLEKILRERILKDYLHQLQIKRQLRKNRFKLLFYLLLLIIGSLFMYLHPDHLLFHNPAVFFVFLLPIGILLIINSFLQEKKH